MSLLSHFERNDIFAKNFLFFFDKYFFSICFGKYFSKSRRVDIIWGYWWNGGRQCSNFFFVFFEKRKFSKYFFEREIIQISFFWLGIFGNFWKFLEIFLIREKIKFFF